MYTLLYRNGQRYTIKALRCRNAVVLLCRCSSMYIRTTGRVNGEGAATVVKGKGLISTNAELSAMEIK